MEVLTPALSSCQYVASQILETSASSPLQYLSVLPVLLLVKLLLSHAVQRLNLSQLTKTPTKIPQKLNRLLEKHSINAQVVLLSNQPSAVAYVTGLLHQNIIFSCQIVQKLTSKQLEAVLLHEWFHMKNRHPLLFLFTTTISSVFWFLPTLQELSEILQTRCEIAADQFAVSTQGTNAYLVQALHTCIATAEPQQNTTFLQTAVASFYSKILDQRIARLANTDMKTTVGISLRGLSLSTLAVISIFTLSMLKPILPVSAYAPNQCTFAECVAQCVSEQLQSSRQSSPGLYSPASIE